MAHALAKENEAFIRRMVKSGRYNNQSEVVRDALRRMEVHEASYLNPPPLTPMQLEEAFGPNPGEEAKERALATGALRALRRSRRGRTR